MDHFLVRIEIILHKIPIKLSITTLILNLQCLYVLHVAALENIYKMKKKPSF